MRSPTAPVAPGRVEDRIGPIGEAIVAAALAVDQRHRQRVPATATDRGAAVERRHANPPELSAAMGEVAVLRGSPLALYRCSVSGPCSALKSLALRGDRLRRRAPALPSLEVPDL